ncbi:hypothetical protein LguiB_020446 [Lonicera macranthoides]
METMLGFHKTQIPPILPTGSETTEEESPNCFKKLPILAKGTLVSKIATNSGSWSL